jgi:prophage regulatory protein
MPRISTKSTHTLKTATGNWKTVRLHWLEEADCTRTWAGDWLLVPLNPSDPIPCDPPWLPALGAELALVVKALDVLRNWLKKQRKPFSLESAATDCFRISSVHLTLEIQKVLHQLLVDLGCTPTSTSTSRSCYTPPFPSTLPTATNGDPRSKDIQNTERYPQTPLYEICRMGTVIKLSGLSRSSIYRLEALGLFPARVKLSGSAVGWRSDEIHSWITSRKTAVIKAQK